MYNTVGRNDRLSSAIASYVVKFVFYRPYNAADETYAGAYIYSLGKHPVKIRPNGIIYNIFKRRRGVGVEGNRKKKKIIVIKHTGCLYMYMAAVNDI